MKPWSQIEYLYLEGTLKMKKMTMLCLITVLCIFCTMFAGVAMAGETETAELKKIGVAFMKNDPFMVPLYDGMKEVCDENGIELIAYYAENDIEKQISQCSDLLQQGIDGLIIMPVDFEGITPALDEAEKMGIPVVSVDAACADAEKTIAYIASDNYKAGYLCGEHVLATLDSAKILVLSHPEIKCTIDRYQGFMDAIEGKEGYEVIAEQPGSGLYDKGMSIMDNWLQQFPEFDVVFAINDGSCQGAIASMQAANRLKGVQTYAVDGQQQMADYILEGLHTAEAAQDPFSMGKGAVELLIKNAKGESFEYENLLEVTLLTEENAKDYVGF
ncbi:MAG: sugar ABC transporter substrate-binding protein [Clostridiales bacterium]|nr:sugar ABC transporter substrate-binding protein [Clostridiales bacterium]